MKKISLTAFKGVQVDYDVPFERLTTMGVGAKAFAVLTVNCVDGLLNCVQSLSEQTMPVLFFGNGSNVIATDGGFDGVIIRQKGMLSLVTEKIPPWTEALPRLKKADLLGDDGVFCRTVNYSSSNSGVIKGQPVNSGISDCGITSREPVSCDFSGSYSANGRTNFADDATNIADATSFANEINFAKDGINFANGRTSFLNGNGERRIFTFAGASLKSIFDFTHKNNLGGGEFLRCIPATCGGAIVSNAGCFGFSMADIVESAVVTDGNQLFVVCADDMDLGYRRSVFQGRRELIILGAVLRFKGGFDLSLANLMLAKKRASQPLAQKSAGSIFKRQGGFAPALAIEQLGLKGFRVGNACCRDVVSVIREVRKRVFDEYGKSLFAEVVFVGHGADLLNAEFQSSITA